MKNIFYSLVAIAISFTFMACPYESKVPLVETPTESVDSKLFGEYEKKGSSTYAYIVSKESAKTYKIVEKTVSSGKEKIYYGQTTTIGGSTFLQTYKRSTYSTSKKTYYIYRVKTSRSGAITTLQPLTKGITEKFETSQEFRSFVKKHKDLSFFYQKNEKYYLSE